ncbi:MAG: helix-turn-helix domain-containing protein [Dehalococcoidia bacterium]|nr:helix-turn-helix domain-containing protein [Dehalococcoidia bacterium]
MDNDVLPAAQLPWLDLNPSPGTPLGRHVTVLENDGQRAVFVGGTAIHIYDADDRAAEAAAVALLARARVASDVALGEAFGIHRNTVARREHRLEEIGMAGVVPAKPGPKGPHKVTPDVIEVVRDLSHLESGRLARAIEQRTGVLLSAQHVRSLRQQARATAVLPTLWSESAVAEVAEARGQETQPAEVPSAVVAPAQPTSATDEPPVVLPDQPRRARYLGAALYYPALEALGFLGVAVSCFRLASAAKFGVQAVMLTLFFLSIFSKTTLEAAKHLRRWDFGPLVGTERAPVVKTLRRKLGDLIKQGQSAAFGTLLARRWVEQGVIATAYLYVDGHIKAYTGKRKLSECWNPKRRMPLPGLLSYFVNDQQGRPLLFLTEEANASLAQAMPRIVAAIREVVGERRFTVIFDRGGFDGKLFAWLHHEGIDFITYQRGEPGLPVERFRRRECHFEGRRLRMWLAEDQVPIGRSGPWHRIVVRTKDGHQTPILTSLTHPAPAKVACLIFARWRQENFFKYSREHHGLDQMLGYAWAEADGARMVPNPERKRIERELKVKRQQFSRQKAEMGQMLLDEPRRSRTGHGIKAAQREAVSRVRAMEQEIKALQERRAELPKHVPLTEAGTREVMRLEQKAIIDRVKMTAYNAEEWLLELLVQHYPNPHDVRALLRSFAELAGEIRPFSTGVAITLDAPDVPLHRRVLRGLCADLNQFTTTFPGTDIPVTYEVAMHHSETAL